MKTYLKSEQYPRKIWELVNNILLISRDRESHLHYQTNSYWFNDQFLRSIDSDTTVVVKERKMIMKLETTIWEILTHWTYLYFLWQWFEKQVFLKLSEFRKIL